MEDVMSLKCRICGMEWKQIPTLAQQVGNPRGSFHLFLIDGIPHDIGSTNLGRKKAAKSVEEIQK
jgi:hypothetical protein